MYSRHIYKEALLKCSKSIDRSYLNLPNTKYLALLNNPLRHSCDKISSRRLSHLTISALSTQNLNNSIKNMSFPKTNQHKHRIIQHTPLRYIHITNPLPLTKDHTQVGQDLGDILKELYREKDSSNDSANQMIGNCSWTHLYRSIRLALYPRFISYIQDSLIRYNKYLIRDSL